MAIASIRPARSHTSGNVPDVADMEEGEIATNIPDGIIWQKDDANALREIYSRKKHILSHDPAATYAAGDPIYYDGVIFTAATAAEKGSAVDYSQPPSAVSGDWRLNDTTPLWTLQRATEGWFPAYTGKIRLPSGEEKTLSAKVIGAKQPDVADTDARNDLTQSMTEAQRQALHGIYVYVTGDREYIYNSIDNAWRDFNTFDVPGNPLIDPASFTSSWEIDEGDNYSLSKNIARYVGRFPNGADRNSDALMGENHVIFQENTGDNGEFWIYDVPQDKWLRHGVNYPVITPDPTVAPDQKSASLYKNWLFKDKRYHIYSDDHGVEEHNQDNGDAFRSALEECKFTGLPLLIRPTQVGYRINGDLDVYGGFNGLLSPGPGAHLNFVDGGLVYNPRISTEKKQHDDRIENISVSRSGTVGPAMKVSSAQGLNIIRWLYTNLRITGSTGHGLELEGTYLGAIHGLFIEDCAGSGIYSAPGTEPDSFPLGLNSIGIHGGEIINCEWGIEITDTKTFNLHSYAIEGNNAGGVWLKEDNRNFLWSGGYTENNAKQHPYDSANPEEFYTDIRVGVEGSTKPNESCSFNDIRFSDGGVSHRRAIWIENDQQKINIRTPLFRAYGGPPIHLVDGTDNTSSGFVEGFTITNGDNDYSRNPFANTARPDLFVNRDESDEAHVVRTKALQEWIAGVRADGSENNSERLSRINLPASIPAVGTYILDVNDINDEGDIFIRTWTMDPAHTATATVISRKEIQVIITLTATGDPVAGEFGIYIRKGTGEYRAFDAKTAHIGSDTVQGYLERHPITDMDLANAQTLTLINMTADDGKKTETYSPYEKDDGSRVWVSNSPVSMKVVTPVNGGDFEFSIPDGMINQERLVYIDSASAQANGLSATKRAIFTLLRNGKQYTLATKDDTDALNFDEYPSDPIKLRWINDTEGWGAP